METTKASKANVADSLRTTIPITLVRMFGLKPGSDIEWHIEAKGNEIIAYVKPGKR